MGKKRNKGWSDSDDAAHDARVDEHLRVANELIDRYFAEIGEPRPANSLVFAERVLGKRER
jgi:hypothetical protein